MRIHTVKEGDTIFKIARKYSTSPMKVIENNGLLTPDRLSVGRELLILTPTRTYSVRGGDTLKKISDRFCVPISEIQRANPYLAGTDKLYHGELISLKRDAKKYGVSLSMGQYYKGCPEDKLIAALPYLTHVAISSVKRDGGEFLDLFSSQNIAEQIKKAGRIPLLRIYDSEWQKEKFGNKYIDALINKAERSGAMGITLAAYNFLKESPEEYKSFLSELKRKLIPYDITLYAEIDAEDNSSLSLDDIDGIIAVYDKFSKNAIPSFDEGERNIFESITEHNEPSKIFMDLSSFAYSGGEAITRNTAFDIAYGGGKEFLKDEKSGSLGFERTIYSGGQANAERVSLESLENLLKKLELISTLGLCGISFDIMRIPTEYLMAYSEMFSMPNTIM